MTLLDVGGEDGGGLSQARRLIITTELQKMAVDLSSYMREHYSTLICEDAAVRRQVIHASNRSLLEFVGEIADTAQRDNVAPPATPSSGNGVVAPLSYHHAGRGTPHGRGGARRATRTG